MSDPSAPSPELVYSIDLGEGDDAYRVVASFWRPPTAPDDTWRLEAFDREDTPDGPMFSAEPELTMNIPAAGLDEAPADLERQVEQREDQIRPLQNAVDRLRDQQDMVRALIDYLATAGRPEPSPAPAPAPTEPGQRKKPKGPRVPNPAAMVSQPGLPADVAGAAVPEPEPSAPTGPKTKGKADG